MNEPVDWPRVLVEHRRWLAIVLRARGIEAGAVEEVLQEVHAEALRSADRLRDPAKVAPWLYRIAVTCALLYRRRLGRRRRHEERYAAELSEPSSSAEPDPLDWLLAEEQQRIVREALTKLTSRDAELLLLKYTEDWSYRQLAEHLGVTTSAVEARLHRAREKLRRSLAQMAPEIVPR
ncbi:RNA polymerase sigma factor [Bythopirellula polymerisocia]|uniref:ECF RNA polymerase sigma-E factor n=1 Tax=Bythopirellula polymerisocia TaxID=2528003 RepID=A0A5C6D5Z3_9BACT|nr:sigma-70 family RNA polymerase sigma factor [Bythopirellula polymerisocia]TWU30289.1 ECF RNA polymerase sigma-E factor [Bythopirellula polymerisocia]